MAFSPIFQRPFSATFDRRAAAAAAVPWWLAGGVAAANAIAVYQPKGAASLAASYVNLANPGTHDATTTSAPTFDATTGWTFNGNSQYLSTNITSSGSAWSIVLRYANLLGVDRGICGTYGAGAERGLALYVDGAAVYYGNGGTSLVSATPTATSGVFCIAGKTGYRDGIPDAVIPASETVPAGPVYLGAWNAVWVPAAVVHANCDIQAVAIYDSVLTAPQVAAVSATMAAL